MTNWKRELEEANEKMNATAKVFGIFKREVYFRAKEVNEYLKAINKSFNEVRKNDWKGM